MQFLFFLSFPKFRNLINWTERLFQKWLLSQEKQKEKEKKKKKEKRKEAALTAETDDFVVRKHNWDSTEAKDEVRWEMTVSQPYPKR